MVAQKSDGWASNVVNYFPDQMDRRRFPSSRGARRRPSWFPQAFVEAAQERVEEVGDDAAARRLQLGGDAQPGKERRLLPDPAQAEIGQFDEHAVEGKRRARALGRAASRPVAPRFG